AAPPSSSAIILLASALTLAAMLSATMSVHLLTVLQASGLALATAVGLGALVGPCQLAARAIEMAIAQRHPDLDQGRFCHLGRNWNFRLVGSLSVCPGWAGLLRRGNRA